MKEVTGYGKLTRNMRHYRKLHRLTQKNVADWLGVMRSTYSRYEEGTNRPNFRVLTALADLYQISVDCLLGREPDCLDVSEDEAEATRIHQLFLNADPQVREIVLMILENSGSVERCSINRIQKKKEEAEE